MKTTLMSACMCERVSCMFLRFISLSLSKLFFSVNSYSIQHIAISTSFLSYMQWPGFYAVLHFREVLKLSVNDQFYIYVYLLS